MGIVGLRLGDTTERCHGLGRGRWAKLYVPQEPGHVLSAVGFILPGGGSSFLLSRTGMKGVEA